MHERRLRSLLLSLALVIKATFQQNVAAPLPAANVAYVKHKTKFYIYGGTTIVPPEDSGQFFELDLSKPWDSVSPAWTQLTSGPKVSDGEVAISLDGKTLLTIPPYAEEPHLYSFDNKTWVPSKAVLRSVVKTAPLTIPTDGSVIIVGGEASITREGDFAYELYSFEADQSLVTQLPPVSINGTSYPLTPSDYRAVWSEHLKSIVFFGGNMAHAANFDVLLHQPTTRQWTPMKTSGMDSVLITDHCMAATDDGKWLFSYGGVFGHAELRSMFLMLDLVTGEWAEATSFNSPVSSAACTIAGDYFLLWGGYNTISGDSVVDQGKPSTPVHIYQISKDKWVDKYVPSAEYLATTPTSSGSPPGPTDPESNSSDKLNIGAIVGGVAGALILIAAIGFFLWRRKKQATKDTQEQSGQSSDEKPRINTVIETRDYHEPEVRRMPQAIYHQRVYRAPQAVQVNDAASDVTDDVQERGGDGDLYTSKHSILMSTRVQAAAPAPHYPSWGANFDSSYAHGDPWYDSEAATVNSDTRTISMIGSPTTLPSSPVLSITSDDYVPPPPLSLSLAWPGLPQARNPHGGNGGQSDGRPGPQWTTQ